MKNESATNSLLTRIANAAEGREAGYKARAHGDIVNKECADAIVQMLPEIRAALEVTASETAIPDDGGLIAKLRLVADEGAMIHCMDWMQLANLLRQSADSMEAGAKVIAEGIRRGLIENQATLSATRSNEWRDLAHEAFLQLEYLHQRERQHSSTGAVLLRLSEKLGFPLETTTLAPQPERTPSATREYVLAEAINAVLSLTDTEVGNRGWQRAVTDAIRELYVHSSPEKS